MSPPLGQEPSAQLRLRILDPAPFHSVDFTPVMDQQTLISSVAALYDRLDAQSDVIDSYRFLEEAIQEQMARNVRLKCELQSF